MASDHFEELGRPPRLLHGGFGLLTVGNLAKPKFWALCAGPEARRHRSCRSPLAGDGAGSLVEAWAARAADGTVGVLVWNGTLDQSKVDGAAGLDRLVTVRFTGLRRAGARAAELAGRRAARQRRRPLAGAGRRRDWPDDDQWLALAAEDHLDEAEPARTVTAGPDGTVSVQVDLPMPGIAYLQLT